MSSLKDKTILITGGTSRLGVCLVIQMLEQGAHVCFTYFKNELKAKDLEKKGARGFKLDLRDMRAIDQFAKEYREEFKLDTLIHNAASVRDHTIKNLTEEEWDEVLTVDLKAPYYLTKKLLALLFKRESGEKSRKKIFFITSRAALSGGIGVSNYAAAKAGVIGLTKSLAQELGRKEILVNAINPGFMSSGMTRAMPEEAIQRNLEASPMGIWSDPDEVAKFMVYLSSDDMSQVTGQVLNFESRKI